MSSVEKLLNQLMQSHWPKCNEIVEQIYEIGGEEAKNALIHALGAKRHHIRTAAIRTLVKFGDRDVSEHITPLLDDRSYETRVEAEKAIEILSNSD
jgi:HEAT repeat protein